MLTPQVCVFEITAFTKQIVIPWERALSEENIHLLKILISINKYLITLQTIDPCRLVILIHLPRLWDFFSSFSLSHVCSLYIMSVQSIVTATWRQILFKGALQQFGKYPCLPSDPQADTKISFISVYPLQRKQLAQFAIKTKVVLLTSSARPGSGAVWPTWQLSH